MECKWWMLVPVLNSSVCLSLCCCRVSPLRSRTSHRAAFLRTGWGTWWSWWGPRLLSACPPALCPSHPVYLRRQHTCPHHVQQKHLLTEFTCDHSYKPREAYVSLRSSLSMKPSRFWSMSVNAWIKTTDTREIKTLMKCDVNKDFTSLNSWIWVCSNMENTLDEALWARLAPPSFFFVFLLAWNNDGNISSSLTQRQTSYHRRCGLSVTDCFCVELKGKSTNSLQYSVERSNCSDDELVNQIEWKAALSLTILMRW